jgi:hypothetical protein
MSATFFLPDKGCGSITAHPTSFGVVLHLLFESARFNMSIDTDPQQQEAASPQVLVVRSFLRYSAG